MSAPKLRPDSKRINDRNRHTFYVQLKRQWGQANPTATPRQREEAINKIAQKCGV